MSRKPCPNANENCKYWSLQAPPELRKAGQENGCFSDLDHIVPRRLGKSALAILYITRHPENHQQLCRAEHDIKTALGDAPLPSDEYMREALCQAQALGDVSLTETQCRKISATPKNGLFAADPAGESMNTDRREAV